MSESPANYRMAHQFLYAWHPARQIYLVYRSLNSAGVEIRARPGGPGLA
jgi:hypothetical protein